MHKDFFTVGKKRKCETMYICHVDWVRGKRRALYFNAMYIILMYIE